MKFLKTLFVLFLIVVIIGGVGYIGWTMFYMPGMNHGTANNQANNTTTGHGGTVQNPPQASTGGTALNTLAVHNKEKLGQITTTINQAVDLITMDPYSKLTLPGADTGHTAAVPQAQTQGNINIYPSGSNTVTITPTAPGATNNTTPAATNTNTQGNTNYVYDQVKLEQLHNGIFKLAQGMMLLSQLNEDLTVQAAVIELNPPDYQTYTARYNAAYRNKIKLNNAINLLNEAAQLVNVNPYASAQGYAYNTQTMEQLHKGIYKLAQGMIMASQLNEEFTVQMTQSASALQTIYNNPAALYNGNVHTSGLLGTWSNSLNLASIFNIILIVLVIVLIISIFGGVGYMMRNRYGDIDPNFPRDNNNV